MILSDKDIKEMIKSGKLAITPLDKSQIGPASVDLTLSDEWYFFRNMGLAQHMQIHHIDLSKADFNRIFYTKMAKTITLGPRQMCLGKTVEKLALPNNVMGKLEGRSRYARMGLIIHTTSALVQPGSDNRQILEVVNLAPFPIKLHAGMRVSQVVFEMLKSPTAKPYRKFGEIAKDQ